MADPPAGISPLPQNWGKEDKRRFYSTPQGSKLIEYSWFQALEMPDSEDAFAQGLERYGFLPNPESGASPNKLPIGFVRESETQPWLGLTCAACHTNQLEFSDGQRTKVYQIDGAPSNADMFRFLKELGDALSATLADAEKLDRFVVKARALGDPRQPGVLKAEFAHFARKWAQFVADSTPDVPWGPARLDAFGMIFNRVSSVDLQIPGNSQHPNAPVSYPFLWDTTHHRLVQWNGSALNGSKLQRLARNVGQVLGVFAQQDLTKSPFTSSAKRKNLEDLEELVSRLRSPRWQDTILPPIDWDMAGRPEVKRAVGDRTGFQLYQTYCVSCHAIANESGADRARTEEPSAERFRIEMTALDKIGTDPAMARAALDRYANTGPLAGQPVSPLRTLTGAKFGPTAPVRLVVKGAVGRALAAPNNQSPGDAGRLTIAFYKAQILAGTVLRPKEPDIRAYKARPLNGIWATAPYLHNGSVPNLAELLKPQEDRITSFYVGSRKFDPVNVGFITTQDPEAPSSWLFDTKLPTGRAGNSNLGHSGREYGNAVVNGKPQMSPQEHRNLLEYLKSL